MNDKETSYNSCKDYKRITFIINKLFNLKLLKMKMSKFYVGLVAVAAIALTTSCLSSEDDGPKTPEVKTETGETYVAPSVPTSSVIEAVEAGDEIVVGATSVAESAESNAELAVAAGFVLDEDALAGSNVESLASSSVFGIEVEKSVETETIVEGSDVEVEKTTTIELTCNPKEASFPNGLDVNIYVNDPDGTAYEVTDLSTRALKKGQIVYVKAHVIALTVTRFDQVITLEKTEKSNSTHSGGAGNN